MSSFEDLGVVCESCFAWRLRGDYAASSAQAVFDPRWDTHPRSFCIHVCGELMKVGTVCDPRRIGLWKTMFVDPVVCSYIDRILIVGGISYRSERFARK